MSIKTGCSVLMSVCASDKPEYLDMALASLQTQTLPPDELIVVLDGPVCQEILSLLSGWQQRFIFSVQQVPLPENRGLGFALHEGLLSCSFELVARMDSDDINQPQRFEKQIRFLERHPEISVVGCWMSCFESNPDQTIFVRTMPQSPEKIARIARFRNPVLHPTVVFRKQAALNAGNYPDLRRIQDYLLWARMIQSGEKISCIPEALYRFRTNTSFFHRRSGRNHLEASLNVQKEFLKTGFIGHFIFLRNYLFRIMVYLIPLSLSGWIRKHIVKL